ncbi:glycosyltransferase family 2 protein [Parafilimonas sp.]|uniref:glycosyltransferase family 2 protein n=1 Tax=Parafilimonas sp. TaxID=1969739 RepID=UPI003F818B30
MYQLVSSIVIYNNDPLVIQNAINSALQTNLKTKLFLIDNSETDSLKYLAYNPNVEYIFNNQNIGYGKAHNIALNQSINLSSYHLVLNPDIKFAPGTLESIIAYMQTHPDVGLLMPKVFYKNGELQKLCNPLPKPINPISRRFFLNTNWARRINDDYELKGFNYDHCLNVPNLSGCFMFLRCDTLKRIGFFDERYFMYMEDVDLCRRIHAVSKTMYYPEASIIHGFEKESYSNKTLLKHHIKSAIKYFNKWGWIFDKERDEFNKQLFDDLANAQDLYN